MWLEIKYKNEVRLVNSRHVMYVCKSFKKSALIMFLTGAKEVHFDCGDDSECAAFIQGLILALNGLDFKSTDEDDLSEEFYIKPLKDDANEALYKYMKLKELLGDRK